jgi:hypothetical protein
MGASRIHSATAGSVLRRRTHTLQAYMQTRFLDLSLGLTWRASVSLGRCSRFDALVSSCPGRSGRVSSFPFVQYDIIAHLFF